MSLHIIRDYLTTRDYGPNSPSYPIKELKWGRKFPGGLERVKELLDFISVIPDDAVHHRYWETNRTFCRTICQQTMKRNRYFV